MSQFIISECTHNKVMKISNRKPRYC